MCTNHSKCKFSSGTKFDSKCRGKYWTPYNYAY